MKIKIKVKGNSANNKNPMVRISVNNHLFYDTEVIGTNQYVIESAFLENNTLKIEHYNKENSDTVVDSHGNIVADLSLELISIAFDNIQIMETVLYSMPFYVNWPDNLVQDFKQRGESPPEYLTNNLFFGFNGTYVFDFSDNIVVEYYKQFWIDESQAHRNQTVVNNTTETFNRMGETVDVNKGSDFTIHDLKRMVVGNES